MLYWTWEQVIGANKKEMVKTLLLEKLCTEVYSLKRQDDRGRSRGTDKAKITLKDVYFRENTNL